MSTRMDIKGLRQCLRKFDEDGYSASYGHWSIGRGGYDLDWELYYDGQAFLDCSDDELELVTDDFTNWDKAVEVVLSEYDWCKWYDWNYEVTAVDGRRKIKEEFWNESGAMKFANGLREDGYTDIVVMETVSDFHGNIIKQNVIG